MHPPGLFQSRGKRKGKSEGSGKGDRKKRIHGIFDGHMGHFPLRKGHLTFLFSNIESDFLKASCFPVTCFANMKYTT